MPKSALFASRERWEAKAQREGDATDYRPPAPPVAAGEPFVTTAPQLDPAAALPDDWWKLSHDPALDDLITRVFAANTDLRVASANLAKASAVLNEARAGRLPSTRANGGVIYGDGIQGAGQSGFPGNLCET